MIGIKTGSHKNKLHAGDQACAHTHTHTHTHTRTRTHTHTHTHTHTYTHTHTLSVTLTKRQTEREVRRKKKGANMHHRRHYCIIDNVTFGKENTNETFEAIKN